MPAKYSYSEEQVVRFRKEAEAVASELVEFLVGKNRSYGNSALEPLMIPGLCTMPAEDRLGVHIADKLNRMLRGHEYPGDDTLKDLAGYLILLLVAKKRAGSRGTDVSRKLIPRMLHEEGGISVVNGSHPDMEETL